MSRIPCDVIRDLFPSYIDEVTSKASNELIEEHLTGCSACREVLKNMRGGLPFAEEADEERKEIDFLRKNKKRNRRIAVLSIAGAALMLVLLLAVRVFLVGDSDYTGWAPMNLKVEGRTLTFDAVPVDSAQAVSALDYEEADGVITVKARSVLVSPLKRGTMHGSYTASGEIREVRNGSRIIWAEGATVSAAASDLFAARHDYVGDMPANNRLAQALNLSSYLGSFTNELETAAEPYGWKILLNDEIPGERLAQKEQDMDAFGYVIVGLVGNLDHVTFVYRTGGEERTLTVTAAEAGAFFGEDIKNCGKNVRSLDALLGKSGLALYAFSNEPASSEEEMWIRLVNRTDTELFQIGCRFYKNGELMSEQFGQNADGSAVKPGDCFWISAGEADFGSWEGDPLLEIEFGFTTPAGEEIRSGGRMRVAAAPGTRYEAAVAGSEAEGYSVEQ